MVLCVIGRDVAGNWQSESSATSISWTKDTTAPSNSAGSISGPASTKTKRTISFTGTTDTTAVLVGDYVVVYDGTKEIARSSAFVADADGAVVWEVSFSSSTLGKGTHTLTAYYYDAAGNRTTDTSPPTASISVKSSGGSGRSGGSSGGGGGSKVATNFFEVVGQAFNEQQSTPEEGEQQQQSGSQEQSITLPTRTYRLGDRDSFVVTVQQQLNTTSCAVAESGPGSPGNETSYFGSLTEAAVKCYQEEYMGLSGSEVTGVLDTATAAALFGAPPSGNAAPASGTQQQSGTGEQEQTEGVSDAETQSLLESLRKRLADLRAQLSEILSNQNQGTTESAEAAGFASQGQQQYTQQNTQPQNNETISGTYVLGDSHPEIKEAQKLLNETVCSLATTGPGSPGNETNYFSPKLQAAITCYQTLRGLTITQTLTPTLYAQLHEEVGG